MPPREFYLKELHYTCRTLEKERVRRNILTGVKITLFVGMFFLIYLFARHGEALYAWAALLALLLFLESNVIESKLLARVAFLRARENVIEDELSYLSGDFSRLDGGEEFRDSKHAYSHDLDLFGELSVFQSINRTVTPRGKQILANWLMSQTLSGEEIRGRQEAAREMSKYHNQGIDFRATGHVRSLNTLSSEHAERWQHEKAGFSRQWTPYIYILPAIVLSYWVLCFLGLIWYGVPLFGSLLMLGCALIMSKEINRVHARLDLFIRSFGSLRDLVLLASRTTPLSRRLQELHETLFGKGHDAREAFSSLCRVLSAFDQRGNIIAAILLNGLYMKDLHLLLRLSRWQETHARFLPGWINALGEMDALFSLANYTFNHPEYATPIVREEFLLNTREMGHPLIPEKQRVMNDFHVDGNHEIHIITGANMAGKSTFLRTVGVNLVMAHCGCVVCARFFAFRPTRLFTSMRATDNLAAGVSYFHAELLRLKQLVEIARKGEDLFVILDEILKGTNSVDKLNGSLRFLGSLRALPVAGIVATHDLQLGELVTSHPRHYFNYCFEISHDDDEIVYDYKLRPGISKNMNASILLEKMGLC
ncbi:MAG: DNA mismatch repair protein MutS [Odoribacteraceae bacterium]|nr:DNA mismatch repair protein MutS [Odoribacteraceae bacterium]